jgi:hypothetical protein
MERAVTLTNRSAPFVASLARARAVAGDTSGARVLLGELADRARRSYVPKYEIAKVELALGGRDRALELLERAYGERSHSVVFLGIDPQLADLHGNPRFERLIEQVGAARRSPAASPGR